MAKYHVKTDNGTYEVEVDESQPTGQPQGEAPGILDTMGALNAMAPWNVARGLTTEPLGEAVAEGVGYLGAPKTGAALGAAVQIAPEILSAYAGLKGLYNSPNPIARGITQTPKQIGQQMNVGEETAGVTSALPEQRGALPRFPQPERIVPTKQPIPIEKAQSLPSVKPVSYPKDPNTLINFMKERIDKFGDKLSPQELKDYRTMITQLGNQGKIAWNSPQGATAAKVSRDATDLYTKAIPGRANLNKAYSVSKTFHPDVINALREYVGKHGKRTVAEALAIATGGAIASRFFK